MEDPPTTYLEAALGGAGTAWAFLPARAYLGKERNVNRKRAWDDVRWSSDARQRCLGSTAARPVPEVGSLIASECRPHLRMRPSGITSPLRWVESKVQGGHVCSDSGEALGTTADRPPRWVHRPIGKFSILAFVRSARRIGARLTRAHPATYLLWTFIALYVAIFGLLSLTKFSSFNATFLDLGLSNHILWLLSDGGVSEYYSSQFNLIYPLQLERPIVFLEVPLYWLAPGIPTLLILQSCLLGFAAFPLYLLTRAKLGSSWLALLIAVVYLVYFPLASANLFDYHEEAFFPVAFFSMCLFWERIRLLGMYVSAIVVALVDPVALAIVALFMIYTTVPRGSGLSLERVFSSALRTLIADRLKLAFLAALVAAVVGYYLAGSLFASGVGTAPGGLNPLQIIFFSINQKLFLLVLLLAPLAFVPLLEWGTVFLLLPYIGFVVFTVSPAHWSSFGVHYTLLATGPIFFGLVQALSTIRRDSVSAYSSVEIGAAATQRHAGRVGSGPRSSSWRREYARPMGAIVLATLVFVVVYSPLSPVNQFVAGGYFAGNHDISSFNPNSPDAKFLQAAINLIPPGASVMTQNNIPQLSGREFVEVPPNVYLKTLPYDYILMDYLLNYFSDPAVMYPFVSQALQNHTFGVVAEGHGALLLERGYSGPIELFQPFSNRYDSGSLRIYTGQAVGSSIVDSLAGPYMWYGPYATLYPGSYLTTFHLKVNTTKPANAAAITLDVFSGSHGGVLASAVLRLGNFSSPATFQAFNLTFSSSDLVQGVEFRGLSPTGVATVTLLGIDLLQLGYS